MRYGIRERIIRSHSARSNSLLPTQQKHLPVPTFCPFPLKYSLSHTRNHFLSASLVHPLSLTHIHSRPPFDAHKHTPNSRQECIHTHLIAATKLMPKTRAHTVQTYHKARPKHAHTPDTQNKTHSHLVITCQSRLLQHILQYKLQHIAQLQYECAHTPYDNQPESPAATHDSCTATMLHSNFLSPPPCSHLHTFAAVAYAAAGYERPLAHTNA